MRVDQHLPPDDLFRLGLALERSDRLHEAWGCYVRLLHLNPRHPDWQRRAIRLLATLSLSEASRFARPGIVGRIPGVSAPVISVVICSVDAEKFAAVSTNYERLLHGWLYEIIGIHDARSLCDGYNRGFARARGDIVIFSHDDIEILSPGFASTLVALLSRFDVVGVAGSTCFPYQGHWSAAGPAHMHGQVAHRAPGDTTYAAYIFGVGGAIAPDIRVLDGVLFGARRAVLEQVPFDATTFDGFHFYDIDFSFRAFRAGFKIAVSNEIAIVHQSRGNFDANWRKYAARFLAKHPDRGAPARLPQYWSFAIIQLETREQVVAFFSALVATAELALQNTGAGVGSRLNQAT